jgi:predicted peroxiredoxin
MDDGEQVLIIMTSGPDTPHRCATPLFLAQLAAVMENEVRMIFTIDGILLLKKGIAERTFAREGGKFVSEFLGEAFDAGVKIYACTPALELHDMTPDDLIDGVEMAGGAALLQWAAESQTVLTF